MRQLPAEKKRPFKPQRIQPERIRHVRTELGMIEGGGAFESLVYTLLYDEDSSVILFGRPGKDSGQDARTKDGTRVYQAKFRNGMTMSTAIDLAKTELDTILKYRKTTYPNSKH